jgi:anaerobic ribonucleoside-triphosphate reductase
MIRLNKTQVRDKINWVHKYSAPTKNAADSSSVDANANVESKNIATLSSELHKDINIQVNRQLIHDEIKKLFDEEIADTYIKQLENHEIYCHDESSLFPYCVAIDASPFLFNGLHGVGGDSEAPQHLSSYCGSYINLVFAIASQFAGAVADVSMLSHFHYFAKKDFGPNYLETHKDRIDNHLNQVVYSINMPAATRGYQSIFYNTSVFDEYYFKGLFEVSLYPDGSSVVKEWEGINALQKYFLSWFNAERTKALLTFPVVTVALKLNSDKTIASDEWRDYIAKEFSEGHSFFVYMDENISSLSSCCRLKSNVSDQLQNTFTYSLGAGGISTGSKNVITLNLNRLEQDGRD